MMYRYLAKSAQIRSSSKYNFTFFVSTEVIAAKWGKHTGVEQGERVVKHSYAVWE